MEKRPKKQKNQTMHILNKEVNNQYLPVNKKLKQMEENSANTAQPKHSTLEYSGGIAEYFELAKIGDKKYKILSENEVIQNQQVDLAEIKKEGLNSVVLRNITQGESLGVNTLVRIPKKPKYKPRENVEIPTNKKKLREMEKENKREFEQLENEAFLSWRRQLAELEEKHPQLTVTPYEKNLNIWRQLWIVIEKCDVLVEIVDARNPLFFKCDDLRSYVLEEGKTHVLLVNKADYLTHRKRITWIDYFQSQGIDCLFFSALNSENDLTIEDPKDDFLSRYPDVKPDQSKVLTKEELLEKLKMQIPQSSQVSEKVKYIGFVGYPNVGKSSIMNVLLQKKKLAVASYPGKTKHYQTIFLDDDPNTCLMDCPGLVFPNFTITKAHLVVNGVMPIDHIRDFQEAVSIILQHVPRDQLERSYKIKLPEFYSVSQFLDAIATHKGFYTGRNLPDNFKVSKMLLKDFITGRLLYCFLRPDYDESKHGSLKPTELSKGCDVVEEEELREINDGKYDEEFFVQMSNDKRQSEKEETTKISKDLKRKLKLLVKREIISDEEFENIETLQDARPYLKMLEETSSKVGKILIK